VFDSEEVLGIQSGNKSYQVKKNGVKGTVSNDKMGMIAYSASTGSLKLNASSVFMILLMMYLRSACIQSRAKIIRVFVNTNVQATFTFDGKLVRAATSSFFAAELASLTRDAFRSGNLVSE